MNDDTIDAWVIAELARWTGNEASYVYAGQLVRALTLLQEHRAALRAYARHRIGCPRGGPVQGHALAEVDKWRCNCGLDALLAGEVHDG